LNENLMKKMAPKRRKTVDSSNFFVFFYYYCCCCCCCYYYYDYYYFPLLHVDHTSSFFCHISSRIEKAREMSNIHLSHPLSQTPPKKERKKGKKEEAIEARQQESTIH